MYDFSGKLSDLYNADSEDARKIANDILVNIANEINKKEEEFAKAIKEIYYESGDEWDSALRTFAANFGEEFEKACGIK